MSRHNTGHHIQRHVWRSSPHKNSIDPEQVSTSTTTPAGGVSNQNVHRPSPSPPKVKKVMYTFGVNMDWSTSSSSSEKHIGWFALAIAIFGVFHIAFIISSTPNAQLQQPQQVSLSRPTAEKTIPTTAVAATGTITKATATDFHDITNQKPSRVITQGTPKKSQTQILQQRQNHHNQTQTHAIPRILIFTHYRNLLLEDPDTFSDPEEKVLAANIHKSIALHSSSPNTTPQVRFLTDAECIQSLQLTFPSLVQYFIQESQGMFKADICRGSALYETGGMYLDVDLGVRKDLWEDLAKDTEFVTARVHIQSHYPNHFFQAILGAAPRSPILYRYLQLFEDHYTGKQKISKGPLGVILLKRAWEQVYHPPTNVPATEIYQEVLYDKRLFPHLHPAPTWGVRRACHFVVVASVNDPQHTEFTVKDRNLHIPLYSRIAGSRMCPMATPSNPAIREESS